MTGPTVRAVRVTWRLIPDDPESSMPPLESSRLPKYGDVSPVWVREVRTRILPGGDAEVTIDYVLAGDGEPAT
jgi:hypothetical protein